MTIETSSGYPPIGLNGTCTGTSGSRNQIGAEVGDTAHTTLSINCSTLRTLANKTGSGTTISFGDFYGKSSSSRVSVSYTFSSNTANASLNVSSIGGYSAGNSCIIVTVNSGVYLYGCGGTGLTLSGGTTGDRLKLINQGYIIGAGGNGGNYGVGCYCSSNGNSGQSPNGGSPTAALVLSVGTGCYSGVHANAITIDNTYGSAYIAGGGGGGGGVPQHGLSGNAAGGGGGAGGGFGGCSTVDVCWSVCQGGTQVCGNTVTRNCGGYPGGLGGAGGNGHPWCNYCPSQLPGGSNVYISGGGSSGGGGGRVLPGDSGGAGGGNPGGDNYGGTPGSGGQAGGGGGNVRGSTNPQGGAGGTTHSSGGNGTSSCGHGAAGGGGGWGANGGNSQVGFYCGRTGYGAAGGNAISLNGRTVVYVSCCHTRVWGSVA